MASNTPSGTAAYEKKEGEKMMKNVPRILFGLFSLAISAYFFFSSIKAPIEYIIHFREWLNGIYIMPEIGTLKFYAFNSWAVIFTFVLTVIEAMMPDSDD